MDISALPPSILSLWHSKSVPMVIRTDKKGEQLMVHLPYAVDNRSWINGLGKSKATYVKSVQGWQIPKSWLNQFVDGALERFGSVHVVQPHNEREVCAPACRNAVGHDCQCSCLGANHGTGDGSGWFDVSDTLAFRWSGSELAVRKLSRKD